MALPQDTRGPHRQERWIACKNVGSQDIPGYGVVQVDDASRQNTDETIVHVKRPTADGHCNVLINGPMPITVGKEGVCTNDYPAYGLYADDTPVTNQVWGSRANAFTLKKNVRGFIIIGDDDGEKVRVNRDPSEYVIAEAELDQDLCGETSGIQVVNAKLLPRCLDFTPLVVTNRRNHRGTSGDRILMVKRACDGLCGGDEEWDIFDVALWNACLLVGVQSTSTCLKQAGQRVPVERCPSDIPSAACLIVNYRPDCSGSVGECDLTWPEVYICCPNGSGG
jgi:hypothetical protein